MSAHPLTSDAIAPVDQPDTLSFYDSVRARHSVRAFRPDPLPDAMLRDVLADAQLAPSNCNTQPWVVHIVSGETRNRLSDALLAAANEGRYSPDFSFDMDGFHGCYATRQQEQGQRYYSALGIARDDEAGRGAAIANNYRFFNAPHVALLFMPSFGDNVRAGGDLGMYGQTFLLALAARGLGGIPQTSVGFFADTVREVLGVPSDLKLLFAMSFGYPDTQSPANTWRIDRAPIEDSVTFHR